ncbi:hypothetical protein ABZP36_023303 [Zizania latifolia]
MTTKAAEMGGEARRRKKTRGRQKIEMKLIEDKDARQVCFSKRREGVFKKANELAVLCGAHVAVVFFSPAGRPHSFGHPSVHAVADRFLDRSAVGAATPAAVVSVTQPAVVYEFNRGEEHLKEALEAEARRRHALDQAVREAGVWTDAAVRRAKLPDLQAMFAALVRVRAEASESAHEIIAEQTILQCTGAAGNLIHYLDAGPFASDCGAGSHHEAITDATMTFVGRNIGHHAPPALPFSPMMTLPSLPPHFNDGFSYSDPCAGYGYILDDGHGHGAVYETEGFYNETTCDFFGMNSEKLGFF